MSRISDNSVAAAKKERDFLEVKVEAAELAKDLRRLTKGLGETGADGEAVRPVDRIREAAVAGLEIKAFQNALGGGSNGNEKTSSPETGQKAVQEASDARARIIESLVKAGKSPEEIEKYLNKLGPHLELAALAKDPMAQLMLYSRSMGGSSEMSLKEIIETIKLVNDMKGDSGGKSDIATLASALVEAFKAGKENIQAANPGMDNFTAYQEGMKSMQTLLANQTESVKQAFTERIKSLEEKLAGADPIAYIKQMKESAEVLGLGGTDKELALQRLMSEDKRKDREFEREKTLWDLEREEKKEARKDKRQGQMIDRIMEGVGTALESPVIKEAGKMVGSKLEGKVPDVRGQAARSQLTEPMQEVRDFTCPKCSKRTEFTNADLVQISNRGGRWVCPTQGCGAAYVLPKGGTAQK